MIKLDHSLRLVILGFGLALGTCLMACGENPQLIPVQQGEDLPGGATTELFLGQSLAFAAPAANLTEERRAAFFVGNSLFNQSWVEAPAATDVRDGLGPTFNARSCSSCHFRDGRGRPPSSAAPAGQGFLLRISMAGGIPGEAPLLVPGYGGQLQDSALPGVPSEGRIDVTWQEEAGRFADGTSFSLRRPAFTINAPAFGPLPANLRMSARVAPAMIGLGLLENIPEASLLAREDPNDNNRDGIRGHANRVFEKPSGAMRIGRFGWKAEQPTVFQQTAGAFLGDMGITSTVFAQENCPETQRECAAKPSGGLMNAPEISDPHLEQVALYSSTLAVPARRRPASDVQVRQGKQLFNESGCANCHVATWTTKHDAAIPELADQNIWPYTDLLLHDLGAALSDDRPTHFASGSQWRTAPLWGLGRTPAVNGHLELLHDGRARGFAEAILWHGGEAQASRDAFAQLNLNDRALLIRFLDSI